MRCPLVTSMPPPHVSFCKVVFYLVLSVRIQRHIGRKHRNNRSTYLTVSLNPFPEVYKDHILDKPRTPPPLAQVSQEMRFSRAEHPLEKHERLPSEPCFDFEDILVTAIESWPGCDHRLVFFGREEGEGRRTETMAFVDDWDDPILETDRIAKPSPTFFIFV